MVQDLRHAARSLRHAGALPVIAILTLAIGIGGVTAMFTIVNRVVLNPLPFKAQDRLVLIWGSKPQDNLPELPFSQPDFEDLRAQARAFDAIGGWALGRGNMTGSGDAEQVQWAVVTASLFDVLGVSPAVGRVVSGPGGSAGHAADRPHLPRVVAATVPVGARRRRADARARQSGDGDCRRPSCRLFVSDLSFEDRRMAAARRGSVRRAALRERRPLDGRARTAAARGRADRGASRSRHDCRRARDGVSVLQHRPAFRARTARRAGLPRGPQRRAGALRRRRVRAVHRVRQCLEPDAGACDRPAPRPPHPRGAGRVALAPGPAPARREPSPRRPPVAPAACCSRSGWSTSSCGCPTDPTVCIFRTQSRARRLASISRRSLSRWR